MQNWQSWQSWKDEWAEQQRCLPRGRTASQISSPEWCREAETEVTLETGRQAAKRPRVKSTAGTELKTNNLTATWKMPYLAQRGFIELQDLERLNFWGTARAAGRGAGHRDLDRPRLVRWNIPTHPGQHKTIT